MNRLRTTSGRSNIAIYEDAPKETDHKDYGYGNDENQMVLDKLEALEDLSESLRDISRAYSHSITIDPPTQFEDDPADIEHDESGHEDFDNSYQYHEARKISETFSTLSSDLDVPGTYKSPPPPEEEYLSPHPQRRIRQTYFRSGQFRSPSSREPLTSSPREHSPSTSLSHRILSTPRSPVSERQRSAAFRNPSSVRAMQLSSPSPPPFANSPRSARHRASVNSRSTTPLHRLQLDGATTPTPSPLSRHPNPNKEYPLVLLHCSITPLPLPYSQTTLQTVLPPSVLEDITLLREKLGTTVLERGILIPHPGEDYEVLEERLFESLDLKRPRVGKCGHFFSDHTETDADADTTCDCPETHNSTTNADENALPTCTTCDRHISISPSTAIHQNTPYTIKVYASNGLLPPTAWTAAWREMEKVDLEVGVALSDSVRRALDKEEDAEMERERERMKALYGQEGTGGEGEGETGVLVRRRENREGSLRGYGNPTGANPVPGSRRVSGMTDASTAACSREPPTTANASTSRQQSYQTAQDHHQNKTPSQRARNNQDQTPLSTLLTRYLTRQTSRLHLRLLLPFLAVLLGLYYTYIPSSPLSTSITHPKSSLDPNLKHNIPNIPNIPLPHLPEILSPISNSNSNSKSGQQELQACTFLASDAQGAGMTALPSSVARSVLDVLSFSSSVSTSTSTSLSVSTATATATNTATTTSTASETRGAETDIIGSVAGMAEFLGKVGRAAGVLDDDLGDLVE